MKERVLVVLVGAQLHEVLARAWHLIAEEFNVETTVVGHQAHVAFLGQLVYTRPSDLVLVDHCRLLIGHYLHDCGGERGSDAARRVGRRVHRVGLGQLTRQLVVGRRRGRGGRHVCALELVESARCLAAQRLEKELRIEARLRVVALPLEVLAQIVELAHVELCQIVRVLNGDDVLLGERLVRQQVLHVVDLEVELLDGVVGEYVATRGYAHDVRTLVEYLEGDRTVELILGVLVKVHLDQGLGLERFARDRIASVALDERRDALQVEDVTLARAVRMLERLKGETAAVERQAAKVVRILGRRSVGLLAAIEVLPLVACQVQLVLLMLLFAHFATMPLCFLFSLYSSFKLIYL